MMSVLTGAALAALLHITPTVVLVKRPDAVKSLLPDADVFLAREVHLSKAGQHLWATIIRPDFDSAVAAAPKP